MSAAPTVSAPAMTCPWGRASPSQQRWGAQSIISATLFKAASDTAVMRWSRKLQGAGLRVSCDDPNVC